MIRCRKCKKRRKAADAFRKNMCAPCYRAYRRDYNARLRADPKRAAKLRKQRRKWSATYSSKPGAKTIQRKARDRWRAANWARELEMGRLRIYGITNVEFDALLTRQKGMCAICSAPGGRRLNVDHDHATGRIRALLCGNCNRGLGMFRESVDFLHRAAKYLKRHQAIKSIARP